MMAELLSDPILLKLMVLSAVMVLEIFAPIPERYHPLSVFRIAAFNLAKKVNPMTERAISQRKIAGFLAPLVLVVPLITILLIAQTMVAVPIVLDGVLMLLALSFAPAIKTFKQIANALGQEQKLIARQLLQPLVLRETENLSTMGIAKASVECLLLRFSHQYLSVIFIYLIAGGVAAIAYRLFFEMAQQWNRKLPHNQNFAAFTSHLVNLIQYLPSRLLSLLLVLFGSARKFYTALASNPQWLGSGNTRWILAAASSTLKISLGGAIIYAGQKIRRPVFKSNRNPAPVDIHNVISWLTALRSFFLALFLGICAMMLFLQ
jgi:adenosylcobinamide-phosphate synthase